MVHPSFIPGGRFFGGLLENTVDSKIRTDHLAQAAVDTVFLYGGFRRMVSLGIELIRQLEYVLGAVLHAESTSLAPVLENVDYTADKFHVI